jgi:EmrB/QacA subfamily drug resistance transporter
VKPHPPGSHSMSPLTPAEVRVIITGAMLALFLSALDQTIVATALPPIAADLGGFTLISWVVTSYLLTSTCVTPVLGKLSDLYGRRRVLNASLILFMAGSALAALAPSMPLLILFRAIQGIGGGGLLTMGQTVIADVVSPRERGRYAGHFAVVWGSASVLGPTVGGLLTQYYGWPWIFWINIPFGLAALLIADRALRKLPQEPRRSRIDVWGVLFLSAGTVAFLLLLSLGGKVIPWTALPTLLLAGVAAAAGALFARCQTRAAEPILPPRFLKDGVIRPVLIVSVIIYAVWLAVSVLAPVYFQVARGASVSEAGLLMIPVMLSSTATANLAGRYTRRHGRYKRPPVLSLPLTILCLFLLAVFAARLSPHAAAALLMVAGFGFGPIFPCCNVAAQNAVQRRDLGAVSGVVAFARSLGGALGVAAASALVLGLLVGALGKDGMTGDIEDLVRQSLTPEARTAVARAFAVMFGACGLVLTLGLVIFARVEDRELGEHPPTAPVPAGE